MSYGVYTTAAAATGVSPDHQDAGRRVIESLGGRVSDVQTDITVTHLVAQKGDDIHNPTLPACSYHAIYCRDALPK